MQYLEYTEPISGLKVRDGARTDDFATDHELEDTLGFDGVVDVDWKNIDTITPQ